jgi:hypothetical protein
MLLPLGLVFGLLVVFTAAEAAARVSRPINQPSQIRFPMFAYDPKRTFVWREATPW